MLNNQYPIFNAQREQHSMNIEQGTRNDEQGTNAL
jgi:hypothetical protein